METRELEIWKDIPGYEGIYQVSSWGNIQSFDIMINHYSGSKRVREGKILTKNVYAKNMYYVVVLCKNKKQERVSIHLLVLELFVSQRPGLKYRGNHKDLDKLNNYYKNLEWVTDRENTSHYYSTIKKASKFIGVTLKKDANRAKPWCAKIFINNKNVYLGMFFTEYEAHQAYLDALKKYGIKNKYADENQS